MPEQSIVASYSLLLFQSFLGVFSHFHRQQLPFAIFFLSQVTPFIFVGPPWGFMQSLQFSQVQYWPICSAACYFMQTVLVQIPFSILQSIFSIIAFPSVWSFSYPLFPPLPHTLVSSPLVPLVLGSIQMFLLYIIILYYRRKS